MTRFGGVDILVNNAVDSSRATVDDVTPEFFDRLFALNVRAPLLLSHYAIASLRKRQGVIVNIGSINAFMGEPTLLVYAATKGALETASRNLANYLKFDRVRVYCLNVGWMDSEGERAMMTRLGHPADFIDRDGKELAARADPEAGRSGGGRALPGLGQGRAVQRPGDRARAVPDGPARRAAEDRADLMPSRRTC